MKHTEVQRIDASAAPVGPQVLQNLVPGASVWWRSLLGSPSTVGGGAPAEHILLLTSASDEGKDSEEEETAGEDSAAAALEYVRASLALLPRRAWLPLPEWDRADGARPEPFSLLNAIAAEGSRWLPCALASNATADPPAPPRLVFEADGLVGPRVRLEGGGRPRSGASLAEAAGAGGEGSTCAGFGLAAAAETPPAAAANATTADAGADTTADTTADVVYLIMGSHQFLHTRILNQVARVLHGREILTVVEQILPHPVALQIRRLRSGARGAGRHRPRALLPGARWPPRRRGVHRRHPRTPSRGRPAKPPQSSARRRRCIRRRNGSC